MEQLHVHDTITGDRLFQVHPAEGRWSSRISGRDDASWAFRLHDKRLRMDRTFARSLFQPNARMLVLTDSTHVKSATVITDRTYTDSDGVVVTNGGGIKLFAQQRMTFGVANYADGDLPIVNRSYSGAVRAILQRMMQWGGIWPLPIDLPADGAGSYSRNIRRWNSSLIADLLAAIEAEGQEIYLRPYLAGTQLRYQTLVGPAVTTGSVLDLPVSVPKSHVANLVVVEDGSEQLTGAFAIGEGNEADTKTAFAWAMAGEFSPVRDAAIQKKQTKDVATLSRVATAELTDRRNTIKEWSFDVVTEGIPVGSTAPGARLNLDVRDHVWIDDGKYSHRVVGARGEFGSKVESLEVLAYGS